MVATGKRFLMVVLLLTAVPALAKTGVPFNPLTDIHWEEIEFTIEGLCICPRPPPILVEPGLVVSYWEPCLLLDRGGRGKLDKLLSGKSATRNALRWA